jgi:hypothetical protein
VGSDCASRLRIEIETEFGVLHAKERPAFSRAYQPWDLYGKVLPRESVSSIQTLYQYP